MPIKAVLFDLGNTLVGYYTSAEFPRILRQCLRQCAAALDWSEDSAREEALFEHALRLNRERTDLSVRPLEDRLHELFGPYGSPNDERIAELGGAFLGPIFDLAKVDPAATSVLRSLRERDIRTAIVSNTPWGSPADAWRAELGRHGLLQQVDATVFCVDVGWRKPHRAAIDRALAILGMAPSDAIFVGDDPRWDVAGAQNAGVRPVLLAAAASSPAPEYVTIRSLAKVVTLVDEAHT
jgi:putative hydrolase of the HAD superfamily